MAFWVKFDTISGNSCLVSKWDDYATGTANAEFYIVNDDGICLFAIGDNGQNATIGAKTGTVFTANQWYHVACTHDGGTDAAECKIY